jgi:hypothetical protein
MPLIDFWMVRLSDTDRQHVHRQQGKGHDE